MHKCVPLNIWSGVSTSCVCRKLQNLYQWRFSVLLLEGNLVQEIQLDFLKFFACLLIRKDLHSSTSPSPHAIYSSILTSRVNKQLCVPGLASAQGGGFNGSFYGAFIMKGLVKLFPVSYPIQDPLREICITCFYMCIIPYIPSAAQWWFLCRIQLLSFFQHAGWALDTSPSWQQLLVAACAGCVCEGIESSLSPASMYHHCQSEQGCASHPVENVNFTSPFPCNLSFMAPAFGICYFRWNCTFLLNLSFFSNLNLCELLSLLLPQLQIRIFLLQLSGWTRWPARSTRGPLLRCRVTFACLSSFIHPVWG